MRAIMRPAAAARSSEKPESRTRIGVRAKLDFKLSLNRAELDFKLILKLARLASAGRCQCHCSGSSSSAAPGLL
jgi:hypothetical protein